MFAREFKKCWDTLQESLGKNAGVSNVSNMELYYIYYINYLIFSENGHIIHISCLHVLGDLALTIVKGPLEALLGVAFGCVVGVFLWYFPSKNGVSSCSG